MSATLTYERNDVRNVRPSFIASEEATLQARLMSKSFQSRRKMFRFMRNCFMEEGNASDLRGSRKGKSGVRGGARTLGMKRATPFYKMKRLGITPAVSHWQDLGAYG